MNLDKLAVIVKNGFDATATKQEMREGFGSVNKRIDGIDTRLDRIENLLIRAHENRIERLEDGMRLVKTQLGIK